MTQPTCRLEDGTPLWLTGIVAWPNIGQYYWTPKGPKKRTNYGKLGEWPILTDKPVLPDPYLAGRIDEVLLRDMGENSNFNALRAKDLLKRVRVMLWP